MYAEDKLAGAQDHRIDLDIADVRGLCWRASVEPLEPIAVVATAVATQMDGY